MTASIVLIYADCKRMILLEFSDMVDQLSLSTNGQALNMFSKLEPEKIFNVTSMPKSL